MEKMEYGTLSGPAPKRARGSKENSIKMKIFNDSVHGQIELHHLLVKIIDTPQFQRLRHLKQLGTKYLIYPGATHTRFEHSIGVAYLAGCMVKILHEKQKELNITDEDLLCVQIAALCHDLGHGPFSHLFDGMFIPAVGERKWEHEDASLDMFNYMLKKNPLMKEMEMYGLEQRDITFIKELIKGVKISEDKDEWTARGRTEEKSFLYEIVANKRNGIDVDKWDYFARDCHHLGIPNGFDLQRLLRSARVCDVKMNKKLWKSICYRDKVADNIYDMFHTRYTLHRQALQHKTGYVIDVMVTDALVAANEKLRPGRKISDAIVNMADYTKLTDHIFDEILQAPEHFDLKDAKVILENVVNRRLPKFVGEARLDEKALEETLKEEKPRLELTKANKRKEYQRILTKDWEEKNPNKLIADKDLEIHVVDLGFGTEKNPIDDVYFYNKRHPNKAFRMEKWQVSELRPTLFHEWIVRMYSKNTEQDYKGEQLEGFQEWCRNTTYVKDDSLSDEQGEDDKKNPGKIFNDSIHGQIELDQMLVKIIDTPQFQRLRNIKQLGANNYVFPGATHTRFEYSIGMAYLAGCLAKVLQEQQKDIISDQDILCVQIAALCYNLGYGPFSYMFIKKFMPEVLPNGEEWKHEVASVWMFLDIVESEKNKKERNFNLDEGDDLEFICELIHGEREKISSRKNRPFLYEIVNNTCNGIDVRKWDYFARDCHHLGLSNSFDYQRLLKSARVCEVEGEKHICFKDTVADNVYDMFHTRYTLYRQSYQHKIGNIIEDKIAKALKTKTKDTINFRKITATCLLDDIKSKIARIRDPAGQKKNPDVDAAMKEFTKLTDHVFEEILYSTDEDARKEIEDIVNRRLPKFVGEARVPSDFKYKDTQEMKGKLEENWRTAVDNFTKKRKTVFLDADDFIIDVVEMDHGMRVGTEKGKNPFDNVYFYNKRNPDQAFKIKKYQVSSLMPEKFDELRVRMYYDKKTDDEEEDVVECFIQWCSTEMGLFTRAAICLYGDQDFRGESQMITEDCRSLEEQYNINEVHSCDVIDGRWNLYPDVDYTGDHYTVVEGAYPKPADWRADNPTVKSLEHMKKSKS